MYNNGTVDLNKIFKTDFLFYKLHHSQAISCIELSLFNNALQYESRNVQTESWCTL